MGMPSLAPLGRPPLSQGPGGPCPGQFTCHQCGKVYRWKRNLRQHLKMECEKEPAFLCPHCPHRSHYRSHLRRHLINKHDITLP